MVGLTCAWGEKTNLFVQARTHFFRLDFMRCSRDKGVANAAVHRVRCSQPNSCNGILLFDEVVRG